jgi:pimeloyl-ACP methyl ester carboxylesterase
MTRVGLLGWSMGGFGALLLASDLGPTRVTGVVAASAALWRRAAETPAAAYDDRVDFDRHSIFGRLDRLAGIPVRLDCGRSDPFIAANRVLAERLAGGPGALRPRRARGRVVACARGGRDGVARRACLTSTLTRRPQRRLRSSGSAAGPSWSGLGERTS